jgi:FKBP-type peptidyl-prolyl cis-trans isomerase
VKRSRILSLLIVPAVMVGLAACGGSGSSKSTPSASTSASATAITSCAKPGSSSKAITTSGDFGGKTDPTVTFKKGLSASTPQASEAIKGSGAKLKSGDYVQIAYSVYQAKTAKKLGSFGWASGSSQLVPVGGTGFAAVLGCARIGDRLAVVGDSTALGFGTSGQIVVVADVLQKTQTHSTGAPQTQSGSLPTVKDSASGEPSITIPSGYKAPAKTTAEVIKAGTGATLAATDTVDVQYKGEVISTGKVFDSTWTKGQPTSFALSQVVAGFKDGLVGQKVGSQVLIVIPAAEGYGANPPEGSSIPKNADLLFVVDIIAKS